MLTFDLSGIIIEGYNDSYTSNFLSVYMTNESLL